MELRILFYFYLNLLTSRTYESAVLSQMSHHLSNLQNFSQSQQNQIYQVEVHDEKGLPVSQPSTSGNYTQVSTTAGSSGTNVVQEQLPDVYPTKQPVQSNDISSWRQSATVEDWKAYLYSTPTSPATTVPSTYNNIRQRTQIALQHQQILLQRQLQNRQMTPFMYNVDSSINNTLNQERLQSQMHNYHQTIQRGYKQAIENASRNAALKAAIQNRRTLVGKLRANNVDSALNYYRTGCVEQRKIRNRPNFYSPELIRYVDPTIFEREWKRAGLAYVESLLDNADEYGYVTIDSRAMKTLATVIDKILPKNLDLNALMAYTV